MIVVILSYNHPELTDRCVRSVQAYLPDDKIILVHNGSEAKWLKQHQSNFENISHLILAKNSGFSGGANAGLKSGFERDHWVLFLTNDCQLQSSPMPPESFGLFSPLIWARKIGRTDSLGGALQLRRGHLRHLKQGEIELDPKCDRFYVPGTAFWLSADVFAATQGFDESLGTYWEDVDLSLRVQNQGLRLGTHTATQVLHAVGKTCHSDVYYTTYLFQRNRKRVCLKHTQGLFAKMALWIALFRSWVSLFLQHLRKRNFSRVRILARAILD